MINTIIISVFVKEQSEQDLHCLPFYLHLLDPLKHGKAKGGGGGERGHFFFD